MYNQVIMSVFRIGMTLKCHMALYKRGITASSLFFYDPCISLSSGDYLKLGNVSGPIYHDNRNVRQEIATDGKF